MIAAAPLPRVRRSVHLTGTVQGVGLRPAIYRLAVAHGLAGFVRNDADGTHVEIEGPEDAVSAFLLRLPASVPRGARVVDSSVTELTPVGDLGFHVAPSAPVDDGVAAEGALVPPDLAPCDACASELRDPADRRYRYPFLSCTACGPRFTVVDALPYDRARTTLRSFPLCPSCLAEYRDPANRRFHAETTACPACGPSLSLVVDGAVTARGDDALRAAARLIEAGAIVAVKGAGGYALACDARREESVRALRQRKLRPHKPFAVMARDLEHARVVAVIDQTAERALASPARPIVLVPARRSGSLAAAVAPGLRDVGVFLPPTPLQQLLLDDGPPLQVMTSGNVCDEPLAKDDDDALRRLRGIADAVLLHDRVITTRADDSVVRVVAGGTTPVRRARGFVPAALALPASGPPVLAVGGEMKSTLCLARDGRALLSPHIGSLRHPDADALFREHAERLLRDGRVVALAHDLHPDYRSTRFALERGLPLVAVQHHHAHVASCLVEHGRRGPVIGIAFDGTGFGDDGTLWGGEALVADLVDYRRVAHLRPLPMLGGERAIREPWRLGLAALRDAGEPLTALAPFVAEERLHRAARLLDQGAATPLATGAGRWFDAAAALCGVRAEASYDGQAAAELEALATDDDSGAAYPLDLDDSPIAGCRVVDLRPAVRALVRDRRSRMPAATVAARFHEAMARAALAMAVHARQQDAPPVVALTGGCFQNRRLLERTRQLLERAGFTVLVHRQVPANDGGLALGQAAVATARLAQQERPCASVSPVR